MVNPESGTSDSKRWQNALNQAGVVLDGSCRDYDRGVALKPANFEWLGFTEEQIGQLNFIDHLGNNGWARNSQTDAIMPSLLAECAELGLTVDRIKEAMKSIGYDRHALHELDRWESKRTTGKFGR